MRIQVVWMGWANWEWANHGPYPAEPPHLRGCVLKWNVSAGPFIVRKFAK